MDPFFNLLSPGEWVLVCAIAALAGLVKGVVGFGLPTVLISGLSTFIAPELALAGLILPTVVTNGVQATRQGWAAVRASIYRFRVFLLVGGVVLLASAQLVRVLSVSAMLSIIAVPVILFALVQLLGWQFTLRRQRADVEAGVGAVTGLFGGMSGVWGPPTVMYLSALGTEKTEQMRVQGVAYGLGAVALVLAHLASGVLRAETLPLSVALIAPALVGQWVGGKVLDRIDQAMFKRVTLVVLLVVGLNLIRRAVFG